ncbi:hypothetical protein G6Z18_14680 [Clostridium perfringens]|uniref:DUF7662 domain-containing protein n=1 Tax=Clostridium perfringens TaxID=1502 RepID=UPI0013E36136|nr:hypothetical protein [Clostridium perfringens]MCI2779157.1 hypothetical protein [Clostridium perfringens]NGT65173.1 hypothetical protein [Clostridium perfringens]
MGKVSKFINFEKFLITNKKDSLKLSFMEIEKIIGVSLCSSAYKYPAYWHPSETHPLGNIIRDCGYKILNLDLKNKVIILKKIH